MPPKRAIIAIVAASDAAPAGFNQPLFARVDAALKIIYDNEHFRGANVMDPLGIVVAAAAAAVDEAPKKKKPRPPPLTATAGVQAPFDEAAFKHAMAGPGVYRCACNEFWLDPFFSFAGNVPINEKNIEHLMATSFREPLLPQCALKHPRRQTPNAHVNRNLNNHGGRTRFHTLGPAVGPHILQPLS